MLKIFFLFTLSIYLIESNQNTINYENIFNLVSVGSTVSGNTFESFNEVSLKDARQCISICTYSKKCKAFDALPVPNGIECRFFDFEFDFFVKAQGILKNKNGVKLYSTKIPIKTCQDWYKAGHRTNGVYKVYLPRSPARSVYCYMEGEGGCWMAFQRRFDGSVDFHTKLWKDYKNGFGDGKGEYWLGNDMLHDITRSGSYDLYVIAKDFNDENQYKRFGGFTIGSEATKYRFHYESVCPGYSPHNLFVLSLIMKFSTADQDNDMHATLNCAESFKGGWWFTECHSDHMNGQYSYTAECPYATGLHWHSWQNGYKCLKETMLLIKEQPSSCT